MGRRKLTVQEIDDCFTGVVLTFKIAENGGFKKTKKKNTMMRFKAARPGPRRFPPSGMYR